MRAVIFILSLFAALLTGCPQGSGQQDFGSLPSLTSDDPNAEAELRAARDAAEAGHAADAEQRFLAFIEHHPSDPLVVVARLGLGRVRLANGDVEGALAQFDIAARASDRAVADNAQLYRGVALHLGERHTEAVQALRPLAGRTTDPRDTVLLLRTLSAAASATGDFVVAVSALDRLAGASVDEEARDEARSRITELVREASAEDVHAAYEQLPREGFAWETVAVRAIRLAFDSGDMARVAAMVAELRSRNVPMTEELAELAVRAERTERADPRVIGAILPLTGRGREVGQRVMRGLMLAAGNPADGPEDPNAPQLVLRDDAGNPERAAQAVEDLVSEHRAIAIVGPVEGAAARAAAQRAQDLGVPLLTLVPDSEIVGPGPLVFRLMFSPDEEARALVQAARARGATRFAVLAPENGYGAAMIAAYTRAVTAAGGQLTATERYANGATSFGEVVRRLAQQPFDALFVPDSSRQLLLLAPALAAGGLISARPGAPAPRTGRNITLLAPGVAVDARLAESAGRYLSGAIFTSAYHAPSATGAGEAFGQAFQARFGAAPDVYAAYGYDAFRIVRGTVEAGETTRDGVARRLGASGGRATVGASGGVSPSRGPASAPRLLEVQNNAFVAIAAPGAS